MDASQVLIEDDPLYFELYDVRNEAIESGNLVERDMNDSMCALRDRGAVQQGFLRELLGLPPHHRHRAAAGQQSYTCFTFETCEKGFRDGEHLSSSIYHIGPPGEPALGILEMDGLLHRGYRATLQPMFIKPRTLTWWRQRWINEIVAGLMKGLEGKDRAELNLQFCARLPVHTVTRAVGMEGEQALPFRHALIRSTIGSGRLSRQEQMEAAQSVERMLMDLITKRRSVPDDDIVSSLIGATITLPDGTQRPLTDREIMINCRLLMIAGGGTSWRQFGITLWALMSNPAQLESVKADRRLVDAAIEESVRWNPTDPVFSRMAVSDTNLGGVEIPAGSVLEICLGAANRDPARWPDRPNDYDLHRPVQTHLGFGIGQHQCLGMNVARSEINVGLNALLDRFPKMRFDPDAPTPHLTGGLEQRGMSAVPVLLT